ncbi:outer membrane beta-barrel protein [Ekhidna sp.]|uniref:type IX secretion/gliding motility protein PorT/SprT n=1 Tax=Ekhidna sp. TaxID=2608089 RepID=UPI0032984354
MQTINARNQLYLRGRKIALASLLIFGLAQSSVAQNNPSDNLLNYEDQWIHYGFLISVHSSKYVIRHSDYFTSPAMDTVHSIIPGNLGGFKLGFVINMKVSEYLDFRLLPTVGFYENDLNYRFTNGITQRELKDATMVELPLLLKYKSARRGNLAMYMVFGINPSLEASGKGDEQDVSQKLELKNWNLAIDVGVGLDIFYPFFKFSPEIRYSYGLRNMLTEDPNDFSIGLEKLTTQNLGIFVTFEGGPSSKRKLGGKTKGGGQIKARQKKRLKGGKGKGNGQ